MKLVDFQERLNAVSDDLRPKVEKTLKCLVEDSNGFEEITKTMKIIDEIVKEQIKKADTKKFK